MYNKNMQHKRILSWKANIEEEVENIGTMKLTNYVRYGKINR